MKNIYIFILFLRLVTFNNLIILKITIILRFFCEMRLFIILLERSIGIIIIQIIVNIILLERLAILFIINSTNI